MNSNGTSTTHTLTALKRWSCGDEAALPAVSTIKAIHVYDFDNTLFASPLPNKQLWNFATYGSLQSIEIFVNGGWWHDAGLLGATGEGIEEEEPRAWKGWWNEQIVDLVKLSMAQKDALTVLLTGRNENNFKDLIKRMVASKHLIFDMVCLKPTTGPASQTFASTMLFKQELLRSLVHAYREADEIRIYEDRPKHTQGFRDFFHAFNQGLSANNIEAIRKPITAEVIQVPENVTTLDSVTEIAQVQHMINEHNLAVKNRTAPQSASALELKKHVFFTAYLIEAQAQESMHRLADVPMESLRDVRYLGNNILIWPSKCPQHILKKVGGIDKEVTWRIAGRGVFENKIWAARVEPVPATEQIHSENATPLVVLALRRGARPADAGRIRNWQPVSPEQAIEFSSKVTEKCQLRIEKEDGNERSGQHSLNIAQKRTHPQDGEDFMSLDQNPPAPYHRQSQHQWHSRGPEERRGGISNNNNQRRDQSSRGRGDRRGPNNYNGRGNRSDRGRGGSFAKGRGRGGGGGGGISSYRSLDDVGESGHGRSSNGDPAYDY